MPKVHENKRLTEAEERYALIEKRIKPFIPHPKGTGGMRREAWRSGKALPVELAERRQTESYVTSRY